MIRKLKISPVQFMLAAGLIVTLALAAAHMTELRREGEELLRELERRQAVESENQALQVELQEARDQVVELEERQAELEQVLTNKAETYRVVTLAAASPRALPARGAPEPVTGLTMPLLSESGFTAADYERAWERLGKPGMAGLGAAFVAAEAEWGVNSLALAAIAVLESGWGTSKIARVKNNYLGLGAFDHDPWGCAFTFDAPADSIYYAAELLATHYLTPGGRWHHGDNLVAVGICYATGNTWAGKVAAVMDTLARAAVQDGEALMTAAEGVRV